MTKILINTDFLKLEKLIYELMGLTCKNIKQESASQNYGACTFEINNKIVIFRSAKTTPKKIGQFVTLYKRNCSGPILPYDMADSVDLFIISVQKAEQFGQFIFPKDILYQKGIISKNNCGGKRAMRIYPPWDIANNKHAKETQAWQILYFFEIQPKLDIYSFERLLSI